MKKFVLSKKIVWARMFASVFRFGSLRIAKKIFRENEFLTTNIECELNTQMFGGILPVKVGRSNTHKLLALEGERFIEERQIVSDLANPGDIIVDVGANIGYYTLLFNNKVGPNGKIIAVEPEPRNLGELRRTIEVNNLSNVIIAPFAIGDTEKDMSLAEGVNGMISDAATGTIPVTQMQLDTLLAELNVNVVNMIKIDIEGYEWYALQGMKNVLKTRPRLFIEVHPALLPSSIKASDVFNLLRDSYSDLRIYVSSKNDSLYNKIRKRYYGYESSQPLSNNILFHFLRAADERRNEEPFWLVCTN